MTICAFFLHASVILIAPNVEEKYHDRPIGEIIDSMKLVMFQAIHMSITENVKMDEIKYVNEKLALFSCIFAL